VHRLRPGDRRRRRAALTPSRWLLVRGRGEAPLPATGWSWSFALRPPVAVRNLHEAPPCEEVGIFPSALWRHSYIRLSDEQFETARAAIEA
jgi:hypothetical protein